MLNQYLQNLTNHDELQKVASIHQSTKSVDELAESAGIKLAEGVCPKCTAHMTKVGSIYRCSCGMMKKAKALPAALKKNVKKVKKVQTGKPGAEVPASFGKASFDKTAQTVVQLVKIHNGDLTKVAAVCESAGMSKEAIMPILKAVGKAAKGVWSGGAKGLAGASAKKGATTGSKTLAALKGGGKATAQGAKDVAGAAKEYGGGLAKSYGAARKGGQGVGQALLTTGAKHPGAAATAMGLGGAAAYTAGKGQGRENTLRQIYMPKSASAEVLEIGKGAGKILAKMAAMDNTPIPMDELRESLQEARDREDVGGRGTRTAIMGGGAGALGLGGAGFGLGKRFGGTKGGIIGAGLGALGGAAGGGYLGKGHGEEEARADKAITMLRALRAHRMGAGAGFRAGVRRGYGMKAPGAGASKTASVEKTAIGDALVGKVVGKRMAQVLQAAGHKPGLIRNMKGAEGVAGDALKKYPRIMKRLAAGGDKGAKGHAMEELSSRGFNPWA